MKTLSAYHYTTAQCADEIIRDGYIRGATAYVPAGEIPIVWFSTAPVWEPTASKGIASSGGRRPRTATFAEMAAFGIARFGVDAAALTPWPMLGRLACTLRRTRKRLETVARREGADPRNWCGSVKPVSIFGLTFDVYDRTGGRWVCVGVLGHDSNPASPLAASAALGK